MERGHIAGRRRDASVLDCRRRDVSLPPLNLEQLIALMLTFDMAEARMWLAGGWAVDAIVGKKTPPHGDVDLSVNRTDVAAVSPSSKRHLRGHDPAGRRRG